MAHTPPPTASCTSCTSDREWELHCRADNTMDDGGKDRKAVDEKKAGGATPARTVWTTRELRLPLNSGTKEEQSGTELVPDQPEVMADVEASANPTIQFLSNTACCTLAPDVCIDHQLCCLQYTLHPIVMLRSPGRQHSCVTGMRQFSCAPLCPCPHSCSTVQPSRSQHSAEGH